MDLLGDWKVKSDTHGLACNLDAWLVGWIGKSVQYEEISPGGCFIPFEFATASEVVMLM